MAKRAICSSAVRAFAAAGLLGSAGIGDGVTGEVESEVVAAMHGGARLGAARDGASGGNAVKGGVGWSLIVTRR